MHLSAAINSGPEKQVKKTKQQAGDRWGKRINQRKKSILKAVNEDRIKK